MQRIGRYTKSWIKTLRDYTRALIQDFQNKEIFLWSQAIAFKVLVTVVPILILVTAIVAFLLQQEQPFEQVASVVQELLPAYQSEQLISFLDQLQAAGTALLGIGVIGLFLSAVTLMTTLRLVIVSVFDEDWHSRRSLIQGYLMDARMVLQIAVFFLLSVALTVFVSNIDTTGARLLSSVGLEYGVFEAGWKRTFQLIGYLLPLLLTILVFAQLYYFLPMPRPSVRGVMIGATIAGIFWEVVKAAFTVYASYVGQFERFAAEAPGLGRLGEAFGLILFFVFWVYYSGVVFIAGSLITLQYDRREHSNEEQTDGVEANGESEEIASSSPAGTPSQGNSS